ncbi:hypothetical protein ACGF12_11080 [Kitasatospora sp. NPDC048296]|uniref:hypothetical protein n=1 Tax=Kitasatospora sp. NPDC048296 TaxID=3364048 RepID=UPI0037207CB9
MIHLLDTSALVRLLREPRLQTAWFDAIDADYRTVSRYAPDLSEHSIFDHE